MQCLSFYIFFKETQNVVISMKIRSNNNCKQNLIRSFLKLFQIITKKLTLAGIPATIGVSVYCKYIYNCINVTKLIIKI